MWTQCQPDTTRENRFTTQRIVVLTKEMNSHGANGDNEPSQPF